MADSYTGRDKDGTPVVFTVRSDPPPKQGMPGYRTILANGVPTRAKLIERRVPNSAQTQMYLGWIAEDANGAELTREGFFDLLGLP